MMVLNKWGVQDFYSQKKDVIEVFTTCEENRLIIFYNFEYHELSSNCWIVHFITENNDKLFFRTFFCHNEENMKLLFHQSSSLQQQVTLKKC